MNVADLLRIVVSRKGVRLGEMRCSQKMVDSLRENGYSIKVIA